MVISKKLLVVLLIVGCLLMAGIAYASIPGPDGVIHGCYKATNPGQGAVITIDSAASCPSGFTALNWNQTGPQGPAGPQGAQGPAGPFSNWNVVQGPNVAVATGIVFSTEAVCPVGQKVLGGGYDAFAGAGVVQNRPGPPPGGPVSNADRWLVSGLPTAFGDVRAYAVCAVVS